MTQFADEISAISRRQEAELVLVVGDDQVRRVKIFKPGRFDRDEIIFEGRRRHRLHTAADGSRSLQA